MFFHFAMRIKISQNPCNVEWKNFWESSIRIIQNGANLANLSGMCHPFIFCLASRDSFLISGMPQYISYNGFDHPNESNLFLTYSYFLHSFFEFFITIYNRHICSLYYSLFILPFPAHSDIISVWFAYIISVKLLDMFFLHSHVCSVWNLSSSFGSIPYKKKEKEKRIN